ncbi:BspA family leucine-rich repeat surface protein [Mycoplasma cottewii]|uniref:BspA family leucine-rich repeat surface protein n=1 Tax=Mycoplasma cottewii TaxID=51364 RepID=A0ABY5U207_9MOLU|nr:BspA family leucine-rich repeat surface protein [Mycoplasma cottewii]UWD35319.1 BspA family leucine-rich repeat surface protein [Mycoplasma cottewii]
MTNLLMILKSVLAVSAANQGIGSLNNDHLNLGMSASLKHVNDSSLLRAANVNDHQSHVIFGNQIVKLGWEKSANGGYKLKKVPSHIKKVPSTLPSHITDLSYAFKDNANVDIEGIEKWDTSNVTSMRGVFYNAQNFNTALNWDTSKVTDMSFMFYNAENFDSYLGDKFSAINVTNMESMFEGAREFNQNVGLRLLSNNRVNAKNMFTFAKKFNQDISYLEVEQRNVRETIFKNVDNIVNENLPLSVDSIASNQIKKDLINFWNNNLKNKQLQDSTYETVLALLKLKAQENSELKGSTFEFINQKDNVKMVELNNNKQQIIIKVNNRFIVKLDLGTVIKQNISEIKNNLGEIKFIDRFHAYKSQMFNAINKGVIKQFISTNKNLVSSEETDYKIEHANLASAIIRNVKTNEIHVVNYKLNKYIFAEIIMCYELYGFPNLWIDETISTSRTFRNIWDLIELKVNQYTPKIYHHKIRWTLVLDDVVRSMNTYIEPTGTAYGYLLDNDGWDKQLHGYAGRDGGRGKPKVTDNVETIYIDKDGNEKRAAWNMNGAEYDDVKVIKRIGFYWDYDKKQCVAYRMPKNVEVVPDYLPIEITSLESMFMHCEHFNQDISSWNTKNVKLMTRMFQGAKKFNNGGKALRWDTSNVKNMGAMFQDTESFNADITGWNVKEVENMGEMFRDAKAFNQPIGGWQAWRRVTNFNNMFNGAISFNQDLSNAHNWPVYYSYISNNQGFDKNTPAWEIINRPAIKPSSAKKIDTNGVSFNNWYEEPRIIFGIKNTKFNWETERDICEKLRSVYNLNPESLNIQLFAKERRVSIFPKSDGWYTDKGFWGEFKIESRDSIRNVIKENTHIGYLENNDQTTVLKALRERFNIDTTGIATIPDSKGRIWVRVLDENKNFVNGRLYPYYTYVNYSLSKNIDTLGTFDTNEIVIDRDDQSLFEQEFIKKNQEILNRNDLNKNLLSFKKVNNAYEISINNGEYIGSIKVSYRAKLNLNELQGLITHVGNFNVKDIEAIISEFLKRNKDKLPELQRNHLRMVDSGEDFLTLSVNTEIQDKYLGEKIVVHFGSRANINNIGLNLNQVVVNNKNEQEILDIFWERNQQIFVDNKIAKDQLNIELKDNYFLISTNNDNFQSEVRVNFIVRTQINSVDVNTHAGSFDILDKDKIIEAFVNNNSSLLHEVNKNNFEIVGDVVDNSLVIRVINSDNYQGEIRISFIIRTQINSVDADTNTGAFNSANTNEIIDAFIKNNQDKLPGLTRSNFEIIGNVTNNSIVVRIINSDNFKE